MNEDSRQNTVLQNALQITGAGTAAYGLHRGLTGKTASKYMSEHDNVGSKILKGYGSGTSKATSMVKDFFTAEEPRKAYAAYSKKGYKMNFKNNIHKSTSYNGLLAVGDDKIRDIVATVPNRANPIGKKKLSKVAKKLTKKL